MGHRLLATSLPSTRQRWQLWNESCHCGSLVLFPLDSPVAEYERLAGLLSDSERARAARFIDSRHSRRHVVAHGCLRQVLAEPLGLAPETIEFATGPHGKPELAGAAAQSGLQFNLSHSDGLGLIGWSWRKQIGVDIEVWRTMRDETGLVRRYFSPAEIAAWEALPEARRHEAFFNLWTRKEAYIKALGRGLSLPLDSFDVSHEGGSGARLLRPSMLADGTRTWSLAAPESGGGISLAVVLEAGFCHIRREASALEY
jgi:4'-phosphopantetheinyl transferase